MQVVPLARLVLAGVLQTPQICNMAHTALAPLGPMDHSIGTIRDRLLVVIGIAPCGLVVASAGACQHHGSIMEGFGCIRVQVCNLCTSCCRIWVLVLPCHNPKSFLQAEGTLGSHLTI